MSHYRDEQSNEFDPLDGQMNDFPFDEVFKRLDGDKTGMEQRDYVAMCNALQKILTYLINGKSRSNGNRFPSRSISMRVVAFAWALNPSLFGDDGPSMSVITKRLGLNRRLLSRYAAEVSKLFAIRNRIQHAHDWNWRDCKHTVKPHKHTKPCK